MWFVEYNVKFGTFWQKFLPSKRFEKFLTRFLIMLSVLEIFFLIRRIQRTLIRNHTIDLLQARSKKLEKSRSRKIHFVQLQHETSKYVSFEEKFLTSKSFRKFFKYFLITLLVSKMFSKTRRIKRTLIRNHTMD